MGQVGVDPVEVGVIFSQVGVGIVEVTPSRFKQC